MSNLRLYKADGTKVADGTENEVKLTGLAAGTVVKAGDYQVARVDGDRESDKVNVPGFTVKTIAVTDVTLNKTATTLTVGGTETLTATVAPANATEKGVTWSTSNSTFASVTNGKVTAVGPGVATITVTTKDGSKTAKCTVTVEAAPEG